MTMLPLSRSGSSPSARVLLAAACCLGIASASFLGGCGDTVSDRDIEFASLAEVRAIVQDKASDARVIDARSPADFAQGHIPGARNLTLPQVSDRKDSLDPTLASYKLLVVYGNDAGSAVARGMTKRLLRAGADDVKMFAGGLEEWRRAGLDVARDPKAKPPTSPTPVPTPAPAPTK